jgi:flagellar motor switch protein FliM
MSDTKGMAEKEQASAMNQGEVDDVFGGGATSGGGEEGKAGIEILIEKALNSHVKLPMLDIIYDRFVRVASNSLRNHTSFTVDVDIRQSKIARFGDYVDSVPIPTMIAVFKAVEWDNFGLVVIESPLVYTFMDILFGGRKMPPNLKVEGRPYTSIEQNIVQTITELLLNDLSSSFDPIIPVTLQLDRLESNPKFAMITRQEDPINHLELNISMDKRRGKVDIILPYSTLEPAKKILAKSFIGDRGSKDPTWLRHFEHEISQAKIAAEVILNGKTSSLKEALDMKVGNTLVLDIMANDELYMKVSGLKVGTGKLGKVNNKMAIQMSDSINIKKFIS